MNTTSIARLGDEETAIRIATDVECPYCESTLGDPWEFGEGKDGAFTVNCPDCRAAFKVERTTEVWFTTSLIEAEGATAET